MYLHTLDIRATVNVAGGAEGEDAMDEHQEPMAAAPVAAPAGVVLRSSLCVVSRS